VVDVCVCERVSEEAIVWVAVCAFERACLNLVLFSEYIKNKKRMRIVFGVCVCMYRSSCVRVCIGVHVYLCVCVCSVYICIVHMR